MEAGACGKNHYTDYKLENQPYRVHRAISFRLESIEGKPHVALMPEVIVTTPDGALADATPVRSFAVRCMATSTTMSLTRI